MTAEVKKTRLSSVHFCGQGSLLEVSLSQTLLNEAPLRVFRNAKHQRLDGELILTFEPLNSLHWHPHIWVIFKHICSFYLALCEQSYAPACIRPTWVLFVTSRVVQWSLKWSFKPTSAVFFSKPIWMPAAENLTVQRISTNKTFNKCFSWFVLIDYFVFPSGTSFEGTCFKAERMYDKW